MENCFFALNRTHWRSPLLVFQGLTQVDCKKRDRNHDVPRYIKHLRRQQNVADSAGAASPTAGDAKVSAPNQRSRVTLTAFLRRTTFSRHDLGLAITEPASTPIGLQGSNLELCQIESTPATAVFKIPIPVSEKKYLWLKGG